MLDILLDTIMDSIKLLPFLFIAYLIMEYIEHKISDKSKEKIKKSGKFGPLIRRPGTEYFRNVDFQPQQQTFMLQE